MVVCLGARVLLRLFCSNFASLFLFYVSMCVIFIGTIYIYKYGLFLNGVQRTKINFFLKKLYYYIEPVSALFKTTPLSPVSEHTVRYFFD